MRNGCLFLGHFCHRSWLVIVVLMITLPLPVQADGDAKTFQRLGFDDRPQICLFSETKALRGQYVAGFGLDFQGPSDLDGGGVLAGCAFFLVTGISPPNSLAFNAGSVYVDGGIPRDPQTIVFNEGTGFVAARVGSYVEVGFPATLAAYDAAGVLLGADTVLLARQTVPLLVEAAGIARVELSAPGARYLVDDLLWGASAGGDLRPGVSELALSVPAGGLVSTTLMIENTAGEEIQFFVRELAGAPTGVGVEKTPAPSPAAVVALGDPVALPNHDGDVRATPVEVRRAGSARTRLEGAGEGLPRLLVYTEADAGGGPAADTDLDRALRSLDLPYTGFYNAIAAFRDALEEGPWDAVIFDHQGARIFEYDADLYDGLLAYVQAGGRLVVSSWQMSEYAAHPLWAALGVTWLEDYRRPRPIGWTAQEPRVFDVPNDVPEFTELADLFFIDGQILEVEPQARVLARLSAEDASGTPGAPMLISHNDGRTLLRAFMDGNNLMDRDQDRLDDTVELWRGIVEWMFAPDIPWLGVSIPEAVVPAGQAINLVVTADASGFAPGRYSAAIQLRSNEAVRNTYTLPVELVVGDGISTSPLSPAPATFTVAPNPFNPATVLSFDLAEPARVNLRIYALDGSLLRTLMAGKDLPPGRHTARWNGRDDGGRSCATGTYLAQLVAGSRREVCRLVLVR
jgi:hypothetical protein